MVKKNTLSNASVSSAEPAIDKEPLWDIWLMEFTGTAKLTVAFIRFLFIAPGVASGKEQTYNESRLDVSKIHRVSKVTKVKPH
jgi:hypothetical protein